jgi:hypothetical protein
LNHFQIKEAVDIINPGLERIETALVISVLKRCSWVPEKGNL